MDERERLATAEQVAAYLGVPVTTLHQWRRREPGRARRKLAAGFATGGPMSKSTWTRRRPTQARRHDHSEKGNRRPGEEAADHGDETGSTISAAERRILVRRRAEAWRAGRELGVLLGLEDLLLATTDPARDDLGRDCTSSRGRSRAATKGRLLLDVAA